MANQLENVSTFEIDGIRQIDRVGLKKLVDEPNDGRVLVDVREPGEYQAEHIPGVVLIPAGDIPNVYERFDKEKQYIFICRSGRRSQYVCKFLTDNGFTGVTNYHGGMLEWDGIVECGCDSI